MKWFWAAMGFLTVMPLPAACRHTEEDLVQSVPFFPLVGLLIGLSAAGIAAVFGGVFSSLVLSVLLVGWLAMVHGGLHLDGLGDTADGFFSPYGRDQVLKIMRDTHIGAFGCMAIWGILSLKVAALASVSGEQRIKAVLLAPLVGAASWHRCWASCHLLARMVWVACFVGSGPPGNRYGRRLS